jgi:Glu-tRNA(Gln) amidotransferase subunit E-like FAD-binding protein
MYPDTDLPPLAVTEVMVESARQRLPERPWERKKRYEEIGVREDFAAQLVISPDRLLFERLCHEAEADPAQAAMFIIGPWRSIKRDGFHAAQFDDDDIVRIIRELSSKGLNLSLVKTVLTGIHNGRWPDAAAACDELSQDPVDESEVVALLEQQANSAELKKLDPAKKHRYLMGNILDQVNGRFLPARLAELLKTHLGGSTNE